MSERMTGHQIMEQNAAAAIAENQARQEAEASAHEAQVKAGDERAAHIEAVEARHSSPEVAAMNEAADVAIYGSRGRTAGYVDAQGKQITSPIKGKIEEIRENPRYGTQKADRDREAEQYAGDVQELLDEGYELSQAKLILDLDEVADANYNSLVTKLEKQYAGTMDPKEARRKATERANKTDYRRGDDFELTRRIIKDEGLFDRSEYDDFRYIDGDQKNGETEEFAAYRRQFASSQQAKKDAFERRKMLEALEAKTKDQAKPAKEAVSNPEVVAEAGSANNEAEKNDVVERPGTDEDDGEEEVYDEARAEADKQLLREAGDARRKARSAESDELNNHIPDWVKGESGQPKEAATEVIEPEEDKSQTQKPTGDGESQSLQEKFQEELATWSKKLQDPKFVPAPEEYEELRALAERINIFHFDPEEDGHGGMGYFLGDTRLNAYQARTLIDKAKTGEWILSEADSEDAQQVRAALEKDDPLIPARFAVNARSHRNDLLPLGAFSEDKDPQSYKRYVEERLDLDKYLMDTYGIEDRARRLASESIGRSDEKRPEEETAEHSPETTRDYIDNAVQAGDTGIGRYAEAEAADDVATEPEQQAKQAGKLARHMGWAAIRRGLGEFYEEIRHGQWANEESEKKEEK